MKLATNELYAELDRLKRERDELQSAFEDEVTRAEKAEGERDALADALREVCAQYENVRNAEGYPFPSRCVQAANELLAQVRK